MLGEQRVGDWRVICQRSGFKVWASETVLEPTTGLRVAKRFADPMHPQDAPYTVKDDPSVPFSSPEPADVFITVPITPADL